MPTPSFRVALAVAFVGGAACAVETPRDLAERLRAEMAALAAAAEQRETITVVGRNGWLFFGPELRHVSVGPFWGPAAAQVSRARQAERADPLPAILDFQKQLDALGAELILVPVPPKSLVYADELPGGESLPDPLPRLDPVHQAFYELLRSEGVRVLDLTDLFLENRSHREGPVFCRQDTHWSGVGVVLAAGALADIARERPWFSAIERQEFRHQWTSVTITGDLWRELGDETVPREEIRLRRVLEGDAPVEPDPASPVVLLGDSHNLVFHAGGDMHETASGLADQLALELGFPVELVAVRGSGATPARVNLLRRAQRDPAYWEGKRLVIWCFAARELTESDGWALVPMAP